MEWVLGIGLAIYLVTGMGQALGNLSRGMMGTAGPLATFVAVTIFWPFMPRARSAALPIEPDVAYERREAEARQASAARAAAARARQRQRAVPSQGPAAVEPRKPIYEGAGCIYLLDDRGGLQPQPEEQGKFEAVGRPGQAKGRKSK